MSAPRDVTCIQRSRGAPDNQETMNLEGTVLVASAALARMLGRVSGDVIGRSLCEFVHDEDVAGVRKAFDLVVTGKGAGPST
jgi:hypothetical protein